MFHQNLFSSQAIHENIFVSLMFFMKIVLVSKQFATNLSCLLPLTGDEEVWLLPLPVSPLASPCRPAGVTRLAGPCANWLLPGNPDPPPPASRTRVWRPAPSVPVTARWRYRKTGGTGGTVSRLTVHTHNTTRLSLAKRIHVHELALKSWFKSDFFDGMNWICVKYNVLMILFNSFHY